MEEVRVTRSASRLSLKLAQQYGSLYIRTQTEGLEVFVDGVAVGPLGSGLIERIPVGKHNVELETGGLYWADEVIVQLGVITQIEATPGAVGSIIYNVPSGAFAEVTSKSYSKVIEGEGTLKNVWVGTYSVQIDSEIHEPFSGKIVVVKGKDVTLTPTLIHTQEYEYQQLDQLLGEIEKQLFGISDITQQDITRLVDLKSEIQSARHKHPELVAKSEFLLSKANEKLIHQEKRTQLSALTQRQIAIEETLGQLKPKRRAHNWAKWLSLSTGVVSLGTSGIFIFLADDAYQKYLDATTTSDVIRYRDEVSKWKTGIYIGLAVGGAGLGSSLLLWATQPKVKQYEAELAEVNEKIQRLEGELE